MNSGATWNEVKVDQVSAAEISNGNPDGRPWRGVAMSWDGSRVWAVWAQGMWQSMDHGVTWGKIVTPNSVTVGTGGLHKVASDES